MRKFSTDQCVGIRFKMADLSCGMKCLKYLLFAFNFVFWICGIVIFGVGIWSRIKAKDFDSLLGDAGSMASAANIMIAAGIFVMVSNSSNSIYFPK